MSLAYYIIDTETTGLNSSYNEVTEIGIIRAVDKVQLYRKIRCEYPERASLDALEITKKTFADLLQGSDKREIIEESNRFFNEDGLTPAHRCIIGHNVNFDMKFLHALWASAGEEFPAHLWMDTIALTTEFIKISDVNCLNITRTATGKISKKLQAACDLVGIKRLSAAHNAQADSRNTYFLWKRLTEEKGIDHLPHHKIFIHSLKEDERANIEDLDMSDVF